MLGLLLYHEAAIYIRHLILKVSNIILIKQSTVLLFWQRREKMMNDDDDEA